MKIIRNSKDLKIDENCAVAIGNFDGVHKGHRFLFEKLFEVSKKNSLKSVVFTFYNHPVLYINNMKKYYITLPDEKIDILSKIGIDYLVIPDFDESFMKTSAKDFLCFLRKNLKASHIVVGENFNFGYGREGNAQTLLEQVDVTADIIKPLTYDGENISSSRIRKNIIKGNMSLVNSLLGYDFYLTGKVVSGNKIGGKLGIPTLNIDSGLNSKIIPASGVYISQCEINGRKFNSVTNIGGAPTIGEELPFKIETHVIDHELENMYGKDIKVEFLKHIRDEVKFSDLDSLTKQMLKDINTAKNFF